MATGEWTSDLYAMHICVVVQKEPAEVNAVTASETLQLWPERLGHKEKCHLRKVLECTDINVNAAETGDFCDGCAPGKAHWKPLTSQLDRSQVIGELINADSGPVSVELHLGSKYYLCLKDDYSKYHRVFFIEQRNEVAKS